MSHSAGAMFSHMALASIQTMLKHPCQAAEHLLNAEEIKKGRIYGPIKKTDMAWIEDARVYINDIPKEPPSIHFSATYL